MAATPWIVGTDWLFDETIAGLKRRANIPTSNESWDDDDFRAYANDSMRGYIIPLLRRLSEEFFVTIFDQSIVSGTAGYRVSYRALGEALRDVQISDGNGGFVSMVRREPGDVSGYIAQTGGPPCQFYLQDDKVVLVPTPSASTGTLRIKAMVRPNKLVAALPHRYTVTINDEADKTLTLTPVPNNAAAEEPETYFADVTEVDVIGARPGFRHKMIDAAFTVPGSANELVFTASTAGVQVGDLVCFTEESPVAQIPAELHPLLAQDIATAVLRATGGSGLDAAIAERNRLEAVALGLFSIRTENQPRYVKNPYGVGSGGGRLARWRR